MVNEERTNFVSAESVLCKKQTEGIELKNEDGANTTLGVVLTNGAFSQPDMNKVASMARAGLNRCVNPVGTMADGDTIYAFSTGQTKCDINVAGVLGARVLGKAIGEAVKNSVMPEEEFLAKMMRKK